MSSVGLKRSLGAERVVGDTERETGSFLSAYTTEHLMKLYVDPINYRKSSYGTLDFLLITFCLHIHPISSNLQEVTHTLQSIRIFRVLRYTRG